MGVLKYIGAILLLAFGAECNVCKNDVFHYDVQFQCSPHEVLRVSQIINRTEGQHPSEELRTNNAEPPIAPFEDWAKLKIQEQGVKVPLVNPAGVELPTVKAIRNYAGKECGAKILASNLEAQHPSTILNDKELDEYMLNPCVEDIAKWPKEFKIWTSERYPSPDWSLLGQYVAEDKRETHAFPMDGRRVYAKYLKVELLSHYGGEHFCSLTFIRVLGVSMVEEYENDAAASVPLTSADVNASSHSLDGIEKNVSHAHIDDVTDFTSTTMAPGAGNQYLQDAKSAMLSAAKEIYGKVFNAPDSLSVDPLLNNATNNSAVKCSAKPKSIAESNLSKWTTCLQCLPSNVSQFWCSLVAAMTSKNVRVKMFDEKKQSVTDNFLAANLLGQIDSIISTTPAASPVTNGSVSPPQQPHPPLDHGDMDGRGRPASSNVAKARDDQQALSSHSPPSSATPPVLAGMVSGHKESVFARMNQRIKALELNVSLSGQYLAELSRRYTQQMQRIERAFNATSRLFSEADQKFQQRLDQQASDLLTTAHKLARIEGALDKILSPHHGANIHQPHGPCDYHSLWPMHHVWCVVAVFANLLIVALCRKAVLGRQEKLVKQLRAEFRTALQQTGPHQLAAVELSNVSAYRLFNTWSWNRCCGLNDILLEKHWKSIVHRSICDYFFDAQKRAAGPEDVPAVISTPHHYLISIFRSQLYFVSVVTYEVPPLLVVEFLHKIVDTFNEYFDECSDSNIKENYVVVYELLDEMLDNGFPLATESNILQDLIKPPNFLRSIANTVTGKTNLSETLPTGQLSSVPWRRAGVKYTNNEAYFDVIEEIDVITDKSGSAVFAEIQGYIDCCIKLTGMPDLTLTFMNPKILDDVSFHPCVRFKRWENERVLSFIPPDGNFRLLSYHIGSQSQVAIPIFVRHSIVFKENQGGRIDLTVGQKQNMGKTLEDVSLEIPMPKSVLNCNLIASQGKYSFDTATKILLWEVGRIESGKPPNLKGLVNTQSNAGPIEANPAINVRFNIQQMAASGLKVSRLDMHGEKYKPFKGVKYNTKGGKFQVRT